MPSRLVISYHDLLFQFLLLTACLLLPTTADAQFGGGAGAPGGMGGGGNAPAAATKPRFQDHVHTMEGLSARREHGDKTVAAVKVVGNRYISTNQILQELLTRKGRFYDYETVLGDVRRLNDMGSFDQVTYRLEEAPQGVIVTFVLHERPIVQRVIYHGNRGLNDRELSGRSGISPKDPLSEFSIESGRRRLLDFYHEKGFNQASVTTVVGIEGEPGTVVFRINEGPRERIARIDVVGNTILSEARLKKIIKSRGSTLGVISYTNNVADMNKIENDVRVLESTYHNLGYLTATVGKRFRYDESGKWIYLTYVVNEGPRFKINSIQVVGNRFITEESILSRMKLQPGDMFDGTALRVDIGEIVYGYGELGFIYAKVEPQSVMLDDEDSVDLVYKIQEGDRWKIGEIFVDIEGEPHLMRETTMLNLVNLREGSFIDRRMLEIARRTLERSQLLETNPQVADPPDIKVIPRDSE